MRQVLFEGGPYDGRLIAAESAVVTVIYTRPILAVIPPDRPSWWRHPLRWLRWRRSSLPLPLPEPQQLTYRDTGRIHNGTPIYATGDWAWFRGPRADGDGDLYSSLAAAYGAVPPMIRQDPQTHWVMDLDWYKQIRRIMNCADEREPSQMDRLLGIEITVMDDGGVPHLENRRYPADWPA
jgi:hypothetical protein